MAPSPPTSSGLRLAVVGVGALGSELCRLLMEAGQAHVLLIDPDALEARNVALSELFREAKNLGMAAGTPKVDVVRGMAERLGLRWESRQAEIADVGWLDLSLCDLVLCCADSVLARVETAGTARSLRLPMLDGGVASEGHPEGRVAFFPADTDQACYLCGLAEYRRAEVLAYALSPSLGCLPGPEFAAMTGSAEVLRQVAQEMNRLVSAFSEIKTAFALKLDAKTRGSERITLSRSAGCPWHELPGPADLVTLPYDEPIATGLEAGSGAGRLELFWPVCLRARCRRCGLVVTPDRRTALVRRRGECGACAGLLEVLESVDSFRAGDKAAGGTPRQLGQPERHLYYWRPDAH